MPLSTVCENFIKAKRNMNCNGHQKRYMFNVTCPFTDAEGLRFTSVTNSPYDYLDYEPTIDHVFLNEPTLEAFEQYVDLMFSDSDDLCYFNILRTLLPEHFADFTSIVQRGKYMQTSSTVDYKVPICIIPVIELQTIEDHSTFYRVKSTCLSLERTHIRLKINSYFRALTTLLNCSEDDIIEVLFQKGVLPSKDFKLICTQKELTIALKRIRSNNDFLERFGSELRKLESALVLIKPKYGNPNTNLCQALEYLFACHPLYKNHHRSLTVETELLNGGKGRLPNAIPNNKRKYVQNPKDTSSLPKKMFRNNNISEEQATIEQIMNDSSVVEEDQQETQIKSENENSDQWYHTLSSHQHEQVQIEQNMNDIGDNVDDWQEPQVNSENQPEQGGDLLCLIIQQTVPEICITPVLVHRH